MQQNKRIPSRLMPQYFPPKGFGPIVTGLIIAAFVLFVISIILKAPELLFLLIPILLYSFWHQKKWSKKLRKMLLERVGHDIGTFSKSLDFRNIDTWVIRAVYEQIQEYITPGNVRLPLSKNDNLFKDLEIDKEDLYEDLLVEIAQRTRRSLDDIDKNPYFHELSTVEDLVYLFNTQPIENINNA